MKIIKKIDNNVALGLDGNNNEVILFGKGIGFPKMPYDLLDLSQVDRTFYNVDARYYKLFEEVDSDLVNLVSEMVDIVQSKINGNWDPYITFSIIDHFNFSLNRIKSGMIVGFPYSYEIELEFPEINNYASWMVDNVNQKYNVTLEKGEITCIAMHLLSANKGIGRDDKETMSEKLSRILSDVTGIIENYFNTNIEKKSLNYYRFRYHIQYFIRRKEASEEIVENSQSMFENMKKTYPETYQCVRLIEAYLEKEFNESCSKDELLYLMIHINRLYAIE